MQSADVYTQITSENLCTRISLVPDIQIKAPFLKLCLYKFYMCKFEHTMHKHGRHLHTIPYLSFNFESNRSEGKFLCSFKAYVIEVLHISMLVMLSNFTKLSLPFVNLV